jgi:8-oxo-dGTP diphosphatase
MTRKARPSARLLMLDPDGRLLLFRFEAPGRPAFWATPGGACDPGESHSDAAQREMIEETGWALDPGPQIAQRTAEFVTFEDEEIWSDERYFLVRVPEARIETGGHTELERRVMQVHRWWPLEALARTSDLVFPEDLAGMVQRALSDQRAG